MDQDQGEARFLRVRTVTDTAPRAGCVSCQPACRPLCLCASLPLCFSASLSLCLSACLPACPCPLPLTLPLPRPRPLSLLACLHARLLFPAPLEHELISVWTWSWEDFGGLGWGGRRPCTDARPGAVQVSVKRWRHREQLAGAVPTNIKPHSTV